jgi:hypothetical protein
MTTVMNLSVPYKEGEGVHDHLRDNYLLKDSGLWDFYQKSAPGYLFIPSSSSSSGSEIRLVGSCEHSNEPSDSIKGVKFLD